MPPMNGNPNGNGAGNGQGPKPPNGMPNGNPAGGAGPNFPNVKIPREGAKQDLRQKLRQDPWFPIPHIETYSGKYNAATRSYYIYFDEALRNSQSNSLAMRRDPLIQELMRHRQLPLISLPFHIETDDKDHPDQISISSTVEKIIKDIPKLKNMLLNLTEAIFYGKYASQLRIGPRRVAGNTWNSVTNHIPVNGDKIRYRFDGTPGIAIRSGSEDDFSEEENETMHLYRDHIKPTMLGKALFLDTKYLRDRFIIHEFEPFDTDYLFEIDQSLAVHGLGMRSRLYWGWNLYIEIWSWIVDALQRVGANGMIFGFYNESNPQAQGQVLKALAQLCKDNIAAFPKPGNDAQLKDIIQRIEPSAVGYDVMMQIVEYFAGVMRRAMLGQDLSSKSGATGLGSGVADLQGNVRQDYLEYDADTLADTLTDQLVKVILRYNRFIYEGKEYTGDDLPFGCRLKFQTQGEDVMGKIQAAQACFDMGIPLDQDDIRKIAGFSPPKKKTSILINPQLQGMHQENQAGVPDFNKSASSLKDLVSTGKQGKDLGMLNNASNRTARFSKSSADCGHTPSGSFSHNNKCQSNRKHSGISSKALSVLPAPIQKEVKRVYRMYSSTFETAQRTAKVLARKNGMNRKQANILSSVLAASDLALSQATSIGGHAAGLGPLATLGSMVPIASSAYLASHFSKKPLETIKAAQHAVRRTMSRIKDTSRFNKKPESTYSMAGRLYLSQSGWGLMKVPNALVRGIFDAIHEPGVILPPDDSDKPKSNWKLNAHVSVLRPDELEKIGGADIITEWGHHFHYQLGPIKKVEPKGWDGMKEVYFIDIDCPELEDMREKYGLSRLPNNNKFRFHVTVAVKTEKKGSGKARFERINK